MEDGRGPFPSHIDDMRRPFIDYVHRATVLSILGLAVRTVSYTHLTLPTIYSV